MFSSFGKLLCTAALASVVLAQNIAVSIPASGAVLHGGQATTIQLEIPGSDTFTEVALVVGVISCAAGCPDVTAGLGQNVYQGVYTPQSNGAGSSYQNVSLVLPSFFNGPAQISVLRVALSGPYTVPEVQYATVPFTLTNVGGG